MLQGKSIGAQLDLSAAGDDIFTLAAQLYPICRSIVGAGVRDTLGLLKQHIDLQISSVPTGTIAFDWCVPREWTIRDAFIKNSSGERVVDFLACNLHVVSHSIPVRGQFRLEELKQHIFTLPDRPDMIPYRTSYYEETWGFCMAHRRLHELPDDVYDVLIDSTLADGAMSYGEYLHRGETDEEVLLSAHVCHPSLANDNCSGVALLTYLAKQIARLRTRRSYRFIFAPGTIGAIVWLSRNAEVVTRITHGLVVSCVGDQGGPTYKKSRRGDAAIDRVMAHVLRHHSPAASIVDFFPYGYDERQYCSPGFNLPVGLFQRSQFGNFPEYHTSGDNLDLIQPEHLAASYRMLASAINILEHNVYMRNVLPKCEPQLGRRGLYSLMTGDADRVAKTMALLWVLNLADGATSLLDLAERAGMPFAVILAAAAQLEASGLLECVGEQWTVPPTAS